MAAALGAAALAACLAAPACQARPSPPEGEPPFVAPAATPTPLPPPSSPPAEALSAARAAAREGRYEEAIAQFLAAAGDPVLAPEALLGAAAAAAEAGDLEGAARYACQAADQPTAGAAIRRLAAYLCALRRLAAGDAAGAAAAIAPWAREPQDDALQPYVWAAYGSALARSGNAAAASSAWELALASPLASPALRASVFAERAAAAAAAGDGAGERAWLERLVAEAPTAPNRYALAQAAARQGDGAAYADQLRAIVREAPASREAALAAAELRAAGLPLDPGEEGYAAYRRRAYADARAILGAAVAEPGLPPDALAFRLYYLAAAHDDAGLFRESVPFYDRAAAAAPHSPYAHRAKYWAARALEAAGDLRAAAARYRELALAGPPGEFSAEAAFRAGYVLLLAGAPAEALAAWDTLRPPPDARTLYWRGRALASTGDAPGARAALEAAARTEPPSFFAREARRALGLPVRAPSGYEPLPPAREPDWGEVAAWLTGDPRAAANLAPQTATRDLLRLGLREEAEDALLALEGDATSPTTLLAALWEAWDAGLTHVAARLASRALTEAGPRAGTAPPDLWRLAYPIDFPALLDAVAARYDLDPLFLAALIRQESLWDPAAVSVAGALGLTQVMPATGEGIAAALGVAEFSADHLLRPAVAIAFGAHYLAGQLERFGDAHQALAAYNAGPGNALRWSGPPGELPADYVERIPFFETRAYVAHVLEAYERYLALYRSGGGAGENSR